MAASRRNLTLHSGTQIWLQKDTGIVESVKDWSETRITSSGGGGYLSEGTGQVSAPIITATSIHRQVFFLKSANGSQRDCDTNLINVSAGHEVTVVWGAKQGKDNGSYLGFYNRTTNKESVYSETELGKRGFGKRRLGCLLSAAYLLFFCSILYGCLNAVGRAMSTPVATAVWVRLFWIWLFVSAGLAVYGFLRRRNREKFYEDLRSSVFIFMREG
ncbi:MAG TPA: hypothetical protein VG267_06555 [Terracidiphilus sp.]|jgi:hypothetical protein|nr:hypothetical protein [Terracidiphilus sp.]